MERTTYLVLEDGRRFAGRPFGAAGEAVGETVFTTGMTGYLETITDKSYLGQLVVQTFPLIGNYGVIPSDFESSAPALSAYIVKHWCREPSNFRSEGDLDTFLKERGVVGLCGVDTRTLTKHLRENGSLNGAVTSAPDSVDLDALKRHRLENAVRRAGTGQPYHAAEGGRFKICLLDFGVKESLIRALADRGCDVTVLPPSSGPEAVAAYAPDGIVLSGGPGDPADNPGVVENLKGILDRRIPVFGVCLGGQLLALAGGCGRLRLKYGHRGGNKPVRELDTGRVFVTDQNHGYALTLDGAGGAVRALFENVNDGTCEGFAYADKPAFAVQFHPGKETAFVYDRFMRMMEENAHAAG